MKVNIKHRNFSKGALILVVALLAISHYATVYLDGNYQAGSKSKIDECEHRLSRDINCVLVAVEDERN